MQVRRHDTITDAETIIGTPSQWDKIIVNDRLLVWWTPAMMEYPGRADTPTGLWVPERWRGSELLAVYDGATDHDAAPNVTWGWAETETGTGTVAVTSVPNSETTMADLDANDQAYVEINPTFTGDILVYAQIKVTVAGASESAVIEVDDNDILIKTAQLDLGYSGTAGDSRVKATNVEAYGIGSAAFTKMYFEVDASETRMIDYDTQKIRTWGATPKIAASTASSIIVGCPSTAAAGTMIVKDFPAIAVFQIK